VVEEFFQDMGPVAEVQVQQVAVKSLHHAEVVVQQISQWQDKIQLSGYHSSEGMGQMIQKNICSSVRRYGKKRRL
jgi:hypothetical protein